MTMNHSSCMSIMIFNVNIYITWKKKNRIFKIKWNKYNIIQFPQCLFEERSIGNIFFISASLVRRGASRPPQRNPYTSTTCSSSLSTSHTFIYIYRHISFFFFLPQNNIFLPTWPHCCAFIFLAFSEIHHPFDTFSASQSIMGQMQFLF